MPTLDAKAEHDFDGWYTSTDYTTKWEFNSTVTADITLYAKWKPLTLAAVIADMAADKDKPTAAYTIPSGNEPYTGALTLTTANSPATVVIDGSNRVVTGGTNSITVGAGVSLTLKNITFTTLPFTVSAGGTLILGSEGNATSSAVVQSNAATAGITVNGGTLELNAGALVKDNHASGIVLENNSVLTMTGGEISGNEAKAEGATYVYGGGVCVKGANSVFTMGGGSIRDNEVSVSSNGHGGGVAIVGGGTFIMTDGSISGNKTSYYGGGVAIKGDGATFTMTGGSISANGMDLHNGGYGGGVYMPSNGVSFTLDGGVITENKARSGAGVMISGEGTTFTMISGAISNNIASNMHTDKVTSGIIYADCGGAYIAGTNNTFNMSGGEISGNTSEWYHGGLMIGSSSSDFNMTGGVIRNNTAVSYGGVRLSSNTTFTGNPRIGNPVTSGSGQGWIYGNTPDDVTYY
jgi:uncharacterized repeat protein (TIGR02543 family)